jgi:hypothetical protein
MNEDFENSLRRSLRPVDAPDGFTERLMAALPAERKPTVVPFPIKAARSASRQFGIPAALAASLLAAVMLGQHKANERMQREELQGIAASEQLMQALRVTSQKLDLAYEAVNHSPAAGDEENRS